MNGNVGVWNQIAVDEELGLAYLPVETPSSDFYGGLRPGNNLFAESIVAVDYRTGQRRWHFQLVHHPVWNMPILGLLPPPSKEFSDLPYVSGNAITGVRYISGPGENVGADAVSTAPAARSSSTTTNDEGVNANAAPQGLPLLKPPYGRITAIDLDRGEFVWQVPHGDTPDSVRNHPALKGLTIPRTGQSGAVGALVTKTLIVAGDPLATTAPNRPRGAWGARGAMLRAYDKKTGQEVGAVYMMDIRCGGTSGKPEEAPTLAIAARRCGGTICSSSHRTTISSRLTRVPGRNVGTRRLPASTSSTS